MDVLCTHAICTIKKFVLILSWNQKQKSSWNDSNKRITDDDDDDEQKQSNDEGPASIISI